MSTIFPLRRVPLVLLLLISLVASASAIAGGESGYLGVYLQDLEPSMIKALQLDDKAGVLISDIADDSPAEKAGLEDGDVILVFDGTDTENAKMLTKAVGESKPGEKVKVIVLRDGKKKTIDVVLGEKNDEPVIWSGNQFREFHGKNPDKLKNFKWTEDGDGAYEVLIGGDRGFLGIKMDDLNSQLGEYFGVKGGEGVLVTEVVEGSPAETAGLKAGDVITRIDGEAVTSGGELHKALAGTEADQKVKIELRRKGDKKEFEVTLGEAPENKFIRKIEILGKDGDFDVRSPKMKMHMAPHFKHLENLGEGDHDVLFFESEDGDDEELQELREDVKDLKEELKKIREELKK